MTTVTSSKYVFKIVVCGDYAVGKTSLVRRFATNSFTHDYLTTIDVNHVSKNIGIEGIDITLSIWDTGGQERFSHLRKRYYQGARGVIFVFDITRPESYRAIEKRWIPEVNGVIDDYIPTIWGTKADLTAQRVVSTNSGDRLARRLQANFFETSALTGQNVEKAFANLSKLILSKVLTSSSQETSFNV